MNIEDILSQATDLINRLNKDIESLKPYERGYNILHDYFDYIPEESKEKVDNDLKKVGL